MVVDAVVVVYVAVAVAGVARGYFLLSISISSMSKTSMP